MLLVLTAGTFLNRAASSRRSCLMLIICEHLCMLRCQTGTSGQRGSGGGALTRKGIINQATWWTRAVLVCQCYRGSTAAWSRA